MPATPSTISYQPTDVVLVAFPFTTGTQAKSRPALILCDAGDGDVVVARITTHGARSTSDVALVDWQRAGLLAPSVVRASKLATLSTRLIARSLGKISNADQTAVAAALQRLFANWP